MYGNMGKVLELDLNASEATELQLDKEVYAQKWALISWRALSKGRCVVVQVVAKEVARRVIRHPEPGVPFR